MIPSGDKFARADFLDARPDFGRRFRMPLKQPVDMGRIGRGRRHAGIVSAEDLAEMLGRIHRPSARNSNRRCREVLRACVELIPNAVASDPRKGGSNWEAGTSPFMRFGIQLYHAFLTTILLRHGHMHHVGDDHVFRCALSWPLYQATPRRRVALTPLPDAQLEYRGNKPSRTVVARKR